MLWKMERGVCRLALTDGQAGSPFRHEVEGVARRVAAGGKCCFLRKELDLFSNTGTSFGVRLQNFALCEGRDFSLENLKETCFNQMLPTDYYVQKKQADCIACVKPEI